MKKTIKLTESDLVKIVKTILNEQSFSELKGTTSKEPIVNPQVLTKVGLNANAQNFKGRWVLNINDINTTFFKTKNLSLFKNLSAVSPKGGEDFFEITLNRFTKQVTNPDRTIKTPSTLDKTGQPKVESITGKGTKTFNTYYVDPTDPNYIWKISKIVASGNGLLAFSRALVTSQSAYPNKLTIGFSQETRTSSAYKYDPAQIGSIGPTLNGAMKAMAMSVINRVGVDKVNDKFASSYFKKSNEDIAKTITGFMYMNDGKFIPADELAAARSNKNLVSYDPTTIVALFNSLPSPDRSLIELIYKGTENIEVNQFTKRNLDNKVKSLYGPFEKQLRDEIVRQYKLRLVSYFKSKNPNAQQTIDQMQFTESPSIKIETAFNDIVFGIEYSGETKISSASQLKTGGSYNLGSATPNK